MGLLWGRFFMRELLSWKIFWRWLNVCEEDNSGFGYKGGKGG